MRIDLSGRKRNSWSGETVSKHRQDFLANSCHFNCFLMSCTVILHGIGQIRCCLYGRKELIGEGTNGHREPPSCNSLANEFSKLTTNCADPR